MSWHPVDVLPFSSLVGDYRCSCEYFGGGIGSSEFSALDCNPVQMKKTTSVGMQSLAVFGIKGYLNRRRSVELIT
jgi:hypothetical protein